MKILPDVYIVGGGDYAFNLSNRLDCHVYVIDGGDEMALIDTGFDGPDEILQNMKEDGIDPGRISKIFSTHYHADHTGALARVKRMLGDIPVIAGAEAAPTIRAGDADQIGLTWAQTFSFYPPEFRWEGCDVEDEMTDGKRFKVGNIELEAIATPGHCMGHYCILSHNSARACLFSSDHIFWGGRIILQNVKDSSVQEYADSMNKLLDYEFEALLPGHLTPSLRNGKRHVVAAADQFNRIGLPKGLLD